MVTVLYRQRHGFDVRIHTNDHPPAHAHVWKGDKELQINLMTFEIIFNRGYNTREIRQIRRLVTENKELLRSVWNEIHKSGERPKQR